MLDVAPTVSPIAAGIFPKHAARVAAIVAIFQQKHGHPPTYKEIAKATGHFSTCTVQNSVDWLKRQNVIEFIPGQARSIKLLVPIQIDFEVLDDSQSRPSASPTPRGIRTVFANQRVS